MAMRSGSGTGVLVALIIFIFLTVGSATAAILLYGQKNSAVESAKANQEELKEILRTSENVDEFKAEARKNNQSLVGYLLNRSEKFRTFATGDKNSDEASARRRFNIPGDMTLQEAFSSLQQENGTLKTRVGSLEANVDDLRNQITQSDQAMSQLRSDSADKVDKVQDSIADYRAEADRHRSDILATKDKFARTIDEKERDHRNMVDQLQDEIDDLRGNHTVVTSRLNELRKVVDAIRIRPKNPAELVDGRVVDVLGSSGQVFIDLGREDRIRPGMTFEVYDDPGQIRVNSNSGEYSRGKASIQVMKVSETTATARVTRASGTRPVVRDDVIANAVFQPEYRFKFLVYGKFDVDGNGSPSENEADFIRSRIMEWGGEVVTGEQLTGDLDFVVLGEIPDYVSAELIPTNATDAEIQAIMDKRAAYDQYDELWQQAINAQIPVLNWNRFRILTGESD